MNTPYRRKGTMFMIGTLAVLAWVGFYLLWEGIVFVGRVLGFGEM